MVEGMMFDYDWIFIGFVVVCLCEGGGWLMGLLFVRLL